MNYDLETPRLAQPRIDSGQQYRLGARNAHFALAMAQVSSDSSAQPPRRALIGCGEYVSACIRKRSGLLLVAWVADSGVNTAGRHV
jgi:hypothetical protein